MNKQNTVLSLLTGLIILISIPAFAGDAPTVDEQIAGLEAMCAANSDARGERQEQKPLFERLGGNEKIAKLWYNVAARHRVNESIKQFMEGVDDDVLVQHLVDFVSAGTGGDAEYTGRSMPDAHRDMKLTDAHFLAAGGDVIAAMQEMEYGQNEIDEVVCILVSLKGQVVLK